MRRLRKVFQVLCLFSCVILVFGCRGTRSGKKGSQMYPEMRAGALLPPPAPGGHTDLTAPGMHGEWENLGQAFGSGEMRGIVDQRWEGVAVYFAYDSSSIGNSERPKLETLADFLRRNPSYSLVIEGHCDVRGSEEYNRGLGERRALAVKDYLINLGIAVGRLQTVSYGVERPVVVNAGTESEHARNRRAEFVFGVTR